MAYWLLSLLLSVSSASQWAVLVAGSNGYWNYRHQADVCHSYQLLISQGVPSDHIILLSYNDVANSTENPFQGHLYNVPGDSPQDVYTGCVVDYQGVENNSTVFLAVITGNRSAVAGIGTERVLESTSSDNVFIYFVDHGAPGLVAFPNDILYADQLSSALQQMSSSHMFNQLVFFLEACYGGSMFDGWLEGGSRIYAMTAANDTESSWGIYCPVDEDIINGEKMYTCLADMFSAHWMDVAGSNDLSQTTLSDMFTAVSALTNLSHVMEYGDMSVAAEPAGGFLGFTRSVVPSPPHETSIVSPWWMGYDVKYQYFAYQYLINPTAEKAQALLDEVSDRLVVTTIFTELMSSLSPDNPTHFETDTAPVTDYECLREAINSYRDICHPITEFSLRYVPILKNVCEEGIDPSDLAKALRTICTNSLSIDLDTEHFLHYLKTNQEELRTSPETFGAFLASIA